MAERPGSWPIPPLLRSECADDFARLRTALVREVAPRGVVEEMYVNDVACIVWEMLRLRRCKAGIVNAAFRDAVAAVIAAVMRDPLPSPAKADHACQEAQELGLLRTCRQQGQANVAPHSAEFLA